MENQSIADKFTICEAAVGEIVQEYPNYKTPEQLHREEQLRAALKATVTCVAATGLLIILYIILVELDIIPSFADVEAMLEFLIKMVVTLFAMICGNVCPLPAVGAI